MLRISIKNMYFKNQPKGLIFLCLTQMWERFSFYGMQSLLVLYLTSFLLRPGKVEAVVGYPMLRGVLESQFGPLSIQAMSSQIYGLYVAFVYLAPLPGGVIADRMLGQRRAVLVGGVLIAIGHFLMASEAFFLFALLSITVGSGLFTPSVAALVGELYPSGDLRREKAFSTFYVAVQVGAFASPLVCGFIGETLGWHYGFSLAGVGMLLGLVAFVIGGKHLAPDGLSRASPAGARASMERRRTAATLAILVLLGVFFWAAYQQVGNVLNLWLLNETDRSVFGAFELKTTTFQAVNPLLLILLTPALLAFWRWLDVRGKEPSPFVKMAVGCLLLAGGYLVLALASRIGGGEDGRVSLWWTIGFLAVLTLGELLFAPTSWALFSRMASPRLASSIMGIWYLSLFGGGYLAGYLGTFWEALPRTGFWVMIGAVAAVGGGGILLVRRRLHRGASLALLAAEPPRS